MGKNLRAFTSVLGYGSSLERSGTGLMTVLYTMMLADFFYWARLPGFLASLGHHPMMSAEWPRNLVFIPTI
jgi:hypothetical protein